MEKSSRGYTAAYKFKCLRWECAVMFKFIVQPPLKVYNLTTDFMFKYFTLDL